jgi:hypothetical protein
MLIYNITLKVDWPIHDAWLAWMQHTHIPEVVATGCFTHSQLLRLLDIDDEEGPTYAAQYFAESKANYNRYLEKYAPVMRKKVSDMWGTQVIAFRSLMQVVEPV